ncbi:hypothetical protein IWW51_005996 [Coemansia sp. RSA 2702]|nr:hypothetical protein IWW51_005996 [Coemansia sp. RSA 2702]
MLTQVFSYLGSTVSYVVIGIPIFLGVYDDKTGAELSSIISLNAFVSIYLIYRFSTVIEQTKRLADLGGYAARVVQLWEALDAANADTESQAAITTDSTNGAIEAVNLTVAAPARPALVSRLSIEVHPGEPLMITGPNGSGKTSLLRTLCGLWRPRSGAVRLPQHDGAPDVWGGRHRLCSDAELARLVDAVGLAHVAARAGDPDRRHSDRQWQRLLSPGEQQKVAIARVLFWRPAFAALDESTSALNNAAEAALYRALAAAGITAVSVSHHDNLAAFHTQRLALDGCGGFELTSI